MAFINFGVGGQATIDGLPVHDEQFVHLLVQFFNSITEKNSPEMLRNRQTTGNSSG